MPRIKTTRSVRIALFVLRFYLIVMLALILIKFLGIPMPPLLRFLQHLVHW